MEEELNEATDSVGISLKDEGAKPLCDNCKRIDYDRATLAERFCIKCEDRLCLSCDQEHAGKEDHLVVVLGQQKETKKLKESDLCKDHNEELAQLFCVCCRKVICIKCQKESHSSHNCSRVEDVADLVSKQAEAEYENLSDMQRHFDKEREKLSNEKRKLMKTVKEMENEIQKRCEEITEFVYNETKTLLKDLDVFKNERLEEIEMERKKMEEHAFTFEKFKEYCDQIKSNTNPRCTCEAEGLLRNIVDDLKTRPGVLWKSGLLSVEFSIQKTDFEQVLTYLSDAVGKFTDKPRFRPTRIVRCPYKMTKSGEVELNEKEVCAMARLRDKLYVLSNSISIRRLQHPFVSIGNIETPEIKSPKNIVSCPKTSCLYIHDKGADCVWKVSVPDHQVSRWLDKVKQSTSFSVTSNAELLMLRNSNPVCLEVYNEYAILLRRLKLPATIPSLSSFDETPSGKYIGLGGESVFTFRRNGSIISQSEPSKHPEYRGKPSCFDLSPYHIFGHWGPYHGPSNQYFSSISSLTFDLASHQILVNKNAGRSIKIRGLTLCYLKETKQLLVLEAENTFSSPDFEGYRLITTTWKLIAYEVLQE